MASLRGAIRFALAWEEDARARYTSWSEESSNINAKKLFLNLAKMEDRHIRFLKDLEFTGDMPVSIFGPDWLDLSVGMTSYPASGDRQLKAIFEYAMSKEVDSANRYHSLAASLPTGRLRALFERLMHEEEYHRVLILEQYNRLLKQY